MMNKLICGGIAAIFTLSLPVHGEDHEAFKTTFSSGIKLTDGNTESLLANASLVTEGEQGGLGSLRLGLEGVYGESKVEDRRDTTSEQLRAFASAKKTLTPRTYASLDSAALYDGIARIDYRVNVGPGYGAYLIKDERTTLSLEVGPSYIWEKVAGVRDDYLALRVGERFVQQLSDTARIWQSAEYMPKADDLKDYLLTSEIGVEAALNARMNLRVVLRDQYDSTPAEGLKKNDLSLIAGFSVSL